MKTVKEAFEEAYGPLPEGVTGCYPAWAYCYDGANEGPTVLCGLNNKCLYWEKGAWKPGDYEVGPNIADVPAHYFKDYFGPEYDKAVSE